MGGRFKTLREELKSLENDQGQSPPLLRRRNSNRMAGRGIDSPKWLKYLLFFCFLGTFAIYTSVTYLNDSVAINEPFNSIRSWINQPNEELITDMGS